MESLTFLLGRSTSREHVSLLMSDIVFAVFAVFIVELSFSSL